MLPQVLKPFWHHALVEYALTAIKMRANAIPAGSAPESQPQGCDARAGDLRIFGGLHAAHAHGTQALAVLHDRHAAFEQAVNGGRAQERGTAAVDHVLVDLAFAAAQSGRAGLGRSDVR